LKLIFKNGYTWLLSHGATKATLVKEKQWSLEVGDGFRLGNHGFLELLVRNCLGFFSLRLFIENPREKTGEAHGLKNFAATSCQNFYTIFGNHHGVFPLCRKAAVFGFHCPAIAF
jgi:hypothetical protein